VKSLGKILFLKRARDRKSVPTASPFHAVITRSLKNSDLTRVFVDFYTVYICVL